MARPIPVLLVCLLFVGCDVQVDDEPARTWSEAQQDRQAEITALYVPADGFAYKQNEQLTGVTVEILRTFAEWVASEYGVALSLDFVEEEEWSTFYEQVRMANDGTVGMGNVTITEERREEIDFSPPYMNNIASLISHEDDPPLREFEELATAFSEHRLLAFEGTLHEERLRDIRSTYAPDLPLEFASSNDEIIQRVAEGGVLAYIDVYNFHRAANEGAPLQRHEIGDDAEETFGYILPTGSSWTPVLEEFFEADGGFVNSNTYLDILQTHLGRDLTRILTETD